MQEENNNNNSNLPSKLATKKTIEIIDDVYFFFLCPHPECLGPVLVKRNEVNCKIFRHAVFKSTNKQVNPHLPKEKCDELLQKDLIYGCCKPFLLDIENDKVEICDYI